MITFFQINRTMTFLEITTYIVFAKECFAYSLLYTVCAIMVTSINHEQILYMDLDSSTQIEEKVRKRAKALFTSDFITPELGPSAASSGFVGDNTGAGASTGDIPGPGAGAGTATGAGAAAGTAIGAGAVAGMATGAGAATGTGDFTGTGTGVAIGTGETTGTGDTTGTGTITGAATGTGDTTGTGAGIGETTGAGEGACDVALEEASKDGGKMTVLICTTEILYGCATTALTKLAPVPLGSEGEVKVTAPVLRSVTFMKPSDPLACPLD